MEFAVGVLAAVCSTSASVPQLWKTYVHNATDDLHPLTMCIRLTGCVLWCVYGVMRGEWTLTVASSIAFLVELSLLAKYSELCPTDSNPLEESRAPTAPGSHRYPPHDPQPCT